MEVRSWTGIKDAVQHMVLRRLAVSDSSYPTLLEWFQQPHLTGEVFSTLDFTKPTHDKSGEYLFAFEPHSEALMMFKLSFDSVEHHPNDAYHIDLTWATTRPPMDQIKVRDRMVP